MILFSGDFSASVNLKGGFEGWVNKVLSLLHSANSITLMSQPMAHVGGVYINININKSPLWRECSGVWSLDGTCQNIMKTTIWTVWKIVISYFPDDKSELNKFL